MNIPAARLNITSTLVSRNDKGCWIFFSYILHSALGFDLHKREVTQLHSWSVRPTLITFLFFINSDIRFLKLQRFGSGSGRIRIIWSDPDPYQETLIWIRVAPKINQNHWINKSKWFVNVLFTWRKFSKGLLQKVYIFCYISEYIINIVYKL